MLGIAVAIAVWGHVFLTGPYCMTGQSCCWPKLDDFFFFDPPHPPCLWPLLVCPGLLGVSFGAALCVLRLSECLAETSSLHVWFPSIQELVFSMLEGALVHEGNSFCWLCLPSS